MKIFSSPRSLAALALVLFGAALSDDARAQGDAPIYGYWSYETVPENPLVLGSVYSQPPVVPAGNCNTCIGNKFGLGMGPLPDGVDAIVAFSLAPGFAPQWDGILLIDPTRIVATAVLTHDTVTGGWANSCWTTGDDCITIPNVPALAGTTVYIQGVAPVPGENSPWTLSDRTDLHIGNAG